MPGTYNNDAVGTPLWDRNYLESEPKLTTELQRRVPAPATLAVRETTVSTRVYVVRPGDTLTHLARRFGTTVSKLAKLNGLDPARYLLIGKHLRVPAVAMVTASAPVEEVRASLGHWASVYGLVTRGDSTMRCTFIL